MDNQVKAQHGASDFVGKNSTDERERFRTALLKQYQRRAKGVLHLGAHLGQEAERYAEINLPVVWVEALPHIHSRLIRNLQQFPQQRAFCALLGNRNGAQQIFYISNNAEGVSSSIFQFGSYGSGKNTLWPELGLGMVDSLTLPMIRLESLLQSNAIDAADYDFWVVDLQGAELLALEGAGNSLNACRALYVEVSTVEVYLGGVLWPQLRQWLAAAGFKPLWEPEKPHDDILFVREESLRQTVKEFHSDAYVRHNQRRLEHLASLGIALHGKSVLEVGAGIGDHTSFYLDRECTVVVTDARPENLEVMRERFSGVQRAEVLLLDMDNPDPLGRKFDIVHCYGLLYHLMKPFPALRFLADHCSGMLLLETCVSYGDEIAVNPVAEPSHYFSQAFYGSGCRPTRPWVWEKLAALFPFVYVSRTQPLHEEFPIDWAAAPMGKDALIRSVFVASRESLDQNPQLLAVLPQKQSRAP